jgi:TIR domain
MDIRYQIALLVPEPADPVAVTARDRVRASIERSVTQLGLDPAVTLAFLDVASITTLDPRGPAAAVYFGWVPADDAANGALVHLANNAVFILPFVPHLEDYTSSVPSLLLPINGLEPKKEDPDHEQVASRVLEELRLLRPRRAAFISYKRDESHGAAHQIFSRLAARSYHVFLDVHSVLGGEEFQAKLWDQMNDADILILLRTANAFTSRWVNKEIMRAQHLGLGILQVLWPGTKSLAGAKLADPVELEIGDFAAAGTIGAGSLLTDAALDVIANTAEVSRARSLAARRTRVVTEFQRAATAVGYDVRIKSVHCIEAERATKRLLAFPIVGHPDSDSIHEATDAVDDCATAGAPQRLVLFDSLGIWERRKLHLSWLNLHLPTRAVAISDLASVL